MKLRNRRSLAESLSGYLFIAPYLILSVIFMLYPIVMQFVQSMYKVKFQKTMFVGLQNFQAILKTPTYVKGITNTLLFTFIVVPLLIVAGIWIAGAIFDKMPAYVSAVRICLYLPVIVSMVVMVTIWRFILDSQTGLVRYFCTLLGSEPVNLLADPIMARIVVMAVLFLVNIGQCVLLYVADMVGISKDLLDASQIDGVSRFGLYRYILIPLSKPTTVFVFITEVSSILKVFVIIQLMTSGGPNYATTTMMYQLYNDAFYYSNNGIASAMGVLMFLMALILISLRLFTELRGKKRGVKL